LNYIFGAGGFGREVLWILRQHNLTNIFFVEVEPREEKINGIEVISQQQFKSVVGIKNCFLAVAEPSIRSRIFLDIKDVPEVTFPNIFDPSVRHDEKFNLYGMGNIVCAGTVITTNVTIGNFNHFNPNTTIGHDANIEDFCTFCPGTNISGFVTIRERCFFGANSTLLQNLEVCSESVIGASALVTKNVTKSGVYVGIPARLRS
jgi:sugar O-acyltransferase (sialic acid O-acetyltransferase NeuD family)